MTRSLARAFTILELVVVMGLAFMILGLGAYYVASPRMEEQLRTEHAKIEDLVFQARTFSVSYQQPFVLRFRDDRVMMSPQAPPQENGVTAENADPTRLTPLSSMNWPRTERFEPEYTLAVRRWGQDDFRVLGEEDEIVWVFDPHGVCEPMEVRLSRDNDLVFLERSFHPLTGLAEDGALVIDKN